MTRRSRSGRQRARNSGTTCLRNRLFGRTLFGRRAAAPSQPWPLQWWAPCLSLGTVPSYTRWTLRQCLCDSQHQRQQVRARNLSWPRVADYRMSGNTMTIFHTEVPAPLRGRGIGERLVREALEKAKQLGVKIVPRCWFVREFIDATESLPTSSDSAARVTPQARIVFEILIVLSGTRSTALSRKHRSSAAQDRSALWRRYSPSMPAG
jgi:predicted GNAT family acetyltransferase